MGEDADGKSANDNGGSSNGNGDINASSFASILAGVQRMRQQYDDPNISTLEQPEPTPSKIVPLPENKEANRLRTNPESIPPRPLTSRPPKEPVTARKVQISPASIIEDSSTPSRPLTSRPDPKPVTKSSEPETRVNNRTGPIRSNGLSDVLINKSQTGNPLLKDSMMKITPWKFDATILSDYYISPTFQIIFLSLKYHKLRPEYIWQRLKKLNKGTSTSPEDTNNNSLRVLLTVVDIDSHQEILRNLLNFCIKQDLSLVLSWSFEEAGNYIAIAKQLFNSPMKSIQSIKGFKSNDYNSLITESLTQIRSVNKTDVSNLLANYKSLKNVVEQTCKLDSNLTEISGLGNTKINYMKRVFSEPFIYNKKAKNDE